MQSSLKKNNANSYKTNLKNSTWRFQALGTLVCHYVSDLTLNTRNTCVNVNNYCI